jgi:hypothetical protein
LNVNRKKGLKNKELEKTSSLLKRLLLRDIPSQGSALQHYTQPLYILLLRLLLSSLITSESTEAHLIMHSYDTNDKIKTTN